MNISIYTFLDFILDSITIDISSLNMQILCTNKIIREPPKLTSGLLQTNYIRQNPNSSILPNYGPKSMFCLSNQSMSLCHFSLLVFTPILKLLSILHYHYWYSPSTNVCNNAHNKSPDWNYHVIIVTCLSNPCTDSCSPTTRPDCV